jgi:large subunit ribosomal protein L35
LVVVPKIKTNRSANKRFKLTGTGKIKRRRAYASHILTTKSPKQKRRLRKSTFISGVDKKNIKRLIPYSL